MQTDAEQRVSLVNRINGALANMRGTEERVRTAERELMAVMHEYSTESKRYAKMNSEFTRRLDDTSEKAGGERNVLISEINESIEKLADLKKRENDAKSECGTARKERDKEQKTLDELRTLLKKNLPPPPEEPARGVPVPE